MPIMKQAVALSYFVVDDVQEGQKAIYHLEAFVAKFMSEYKSWSIAVLG